MRAQRENTAFSIIDDKNQMLSHECDRSCIVQNHDESKHMFYKYVLFFLVDYKCVFAGDGTEAIHLSSTDMFIQYNNSQAEFQTNSTNENVILLLYNSSKKPNS